MFISSPVIQDGATYEVTPDLGSIVTNGTYFSLHTVSQYEDVTYYNLLQTCVV
jgi:hypothetical protein